jgi:phosphohistidine phosphatase
MKLYLVRHGDAVSSEVDPGRPLSNRGRADVRRVASFLAQTGVQPPNSIRHSGKRRAEQTAELLADALGTTTRVEELPGLDPHDSTDEFLYTLHEWTEDTMVVGHLPFLEKLVSRLLVGDESASVVSFSPATIVCLERAEAGRWCVIWMVCPELLSGNGRDAP